MTTTNTQQISISMDGIWAGTGTLRNGIIADCGAQFCDDADESDLIYSMIEDAIAEGKDSLKVQLDDESKHVFTWSLE